jgi:hypothetical protein
MVLGFYERDINGRRVISHAGDTNFFHAELSLFLAENVGLYIAMNSTGREGAAHAVRSALFEQFADRYLPGPSPDGEVDDATAARHARMMAGAYENSRRSQSNFLSLLFAAGQLQITPTKDGSILVPDLRGLNGAPTVWREIAPFVWREANGHWRLAAVVKNGQVVRFSIDQLPFMVFDRTPWWKSSALFGPVLGIALVLVALTAFFWPVIAIVRWRYKAPFALEGQQALAYRAVRIGALATSLVFAVWIGTIAAMTGEVGDMLSSKTDGWIMTLRVLSLVAFGGAAAAALWNAWFVWTGKRSWWAKVWSTALALACAVILAYALAFRLIGFDANY